ncbi:hypothetical protein ACFV4P_35030 [Kitasatospora sp. NPDC059795]|uniref:hypothetical protein n=1 Tax=Kitasatospora sp. NPDC059795 TaxID=3346949 RepID=UPI003654A10D
MTTAARPARTSPSGPDTVGPEPASGAMLPTSQDCDQPAARPVSGVPRATNQPRTRSRRAARVGERPQPQDGLEQPGEEQQREGAEQQPGEAGPEVGGTLARGGRGLAQARGTAGRLHAPAERQAALQ